MTYGNFKKFVLAFVKRTAAHLTVDGLDCLGAAINAARKYSERIVDFEHNRVRGTIVIDLVNGTEISAAKDLADASLSIKTIKAATVQYDTTTTLPIALIARQDHLGRVKRQFDHTLRLVDVSDVDFTTVPEMALVRFGTKLYLTPNTGSSYAASNPSTITVGLDVIKWLPDYVNDADTDFLLEHCYDYLLLRTVENLNLFLKEDVRIPINHQMVEAAWRTVKIWDSSLLNTAQDVSTGLD